MSDGSLDEYASDYESKRIDWMEWEMGYLKKAVEESKIGSKNFETKQKIHQKKRDEKMKWKAKL